MKLSTDSTYSRAFLYASVIGAGLLYFFIALIYELERFLAGEETSLRLDGQFVFRTLSQHWFSLLLWLGIIFAVVVWRARLLQSVSAREDLLHRILDTVADGIYMTDRNGAMTYANRSTEEMLGLTRAQIAEHTYHDDYWKITTVDGKPFPEEEQPFAQVMRAGQSVYGVEQVIHRTDGKQVVVSINAAPLRNAEGIIIGEIGAMADITKRRRAEQELRESETRFRSLFESMLEGFAYCKMLFEDNQPQDFIYLDVNKAFEELTGLKDVIGKKVTEVIPGIRESDPELLEIYGRVALTGKPERFEIFLQSLQMWFSISVYSPEKEHFVAMFDVITERKRAAQALQESEDRYRELYDKAPIAYYSVDAKDGRLRIANHRMAEMLGYSLDDLIGRPIFDLYPDTPAGKEKAKLVFERFRAGEEIRGEEIQMQSATGKIFWASISVRGVRDAQGNIVYSHSMALDITERKQAEAEIAHRNQELAALNQIGQALNYRATPPEILELIYTNINSLVDNRNFYIALYDEANQQISFPIYAIDGERQTRSSRPLGNGITERILRTKSPVWIPRDMDAALKERGIDLIGRPARCFLGVPMLVGDKAIGVIAVQDYEKENIYQQSHVELLSTFASQAAIALDNTRLLDAVQQSERKYRNIFENAIVGIYQTSLEGKWLTVNSALARMLGYESPVQMIAEMSDLNSQFYVDPNRRADFLRQMEEHDAIWGFESEVWRRDGSLIWFSENARTIRDQAGNRIGFEGTTIDITDRKQVDRLKSEFVSVVSHELRTPLTSIRGSLGLIAGGVAGEIAPKAKSLVDIAYKNSERLILLINDILDIEKIESGKMVFDNRPIEMLPLLEQAVEANANYAEQYGIKLSLNNNLSIVMVNADQGRLTQVVTNLISNAVKFSTRGGVVDITVARRKANVRVSVIDHGSGIPEEFQSRIFQKFAQADSSTTRQRGGTGLGLNICKAIVEKLGGRIGFESQPNLGTTFFFDLPEWRDETTVSPAAAETRVLICEDDHDTAALLQLLLRQAGFASDLAYDAAQAKALLRKNHYAALTLDLVLPDEDGISFIRDLRGHDDTRALPVIVVSVRAEQGRTALNGDAVQVIDWISKPIDAKRLIGAVQCATAHSSKPPLILHIEDDEDVFQVAALMLQDVARVEHAGSLREARQRLRQKHYDLAILDLEMPDGSGLELVPLLQEQTPPVPVVVFSVEEINQETAAKVSAVLIKSRTSNEKLVETIRSLMQAHQPEIA